MIPSFRRRFASWSDALAPGTVLDDPVVLPRRRDELLRLEHVVRARLLDQDVLARLHRPDRLQRVVEVGRSDRYRVDGLVVEQPADIGVRRGALCGRGLDYPLALVHHALVDVAQRSDLDVRDLRVGLEMRAPAAVEANDADPHPVVRIQLHPRVEHRRQRHRAHQKMSSTDLAHDFSFAGRLLQGGPHPRPGRARARGLYLLNR